MAAMAFLVFQNHSRSALKELLRKALQREMYARQQEVMEARKQRFDTAACSTSIGITVHGDSRR